jgi:hypothetical protein
MPYIHPIGRTGAIGIALLPENSLLNPSLVVDRRHDLAMLVGALHLGFCDSNGTQAYRTS